MPFRGMKEPGPALRLISFGRREQGSLVVLGIAADAKHLEDIKCEVLLLRCWLPLGSGWALPQALLRHRRKARLLPNWSNE